MVSVAPETGPAIPWAAGRVRPVQPPNLPDPRIHPVIQVLGLHAWFLQLHHDQAHALLRYLFNFNLDEGSPPPALYLQALPNTKLADCYDMSSTADQLSFVRLVHWKGQETYPEPPKEDPPSMERLSIHDSRAPAPGHSAPPSEDSPGVKPSSVYDCYTAAVVPTSRAAMRAALGSNPWAPSVASYLLDRSGEWTSGRVRLSLGHAAATSDGPAYVQGHLEEHSAGLKVRDLIPLLYGWVRIGASTGDKLTLTTPGNMVVNDQTPTAFDEVPAGDSMTLSLGVFLRIEAGKAVGWSPFKTPALILILGVYESVRLLSASFQISVPSGQGNEGMVAVVSAGRTLEKDDWYMAPIVKIFPGSDNGSVMGEFALPASHPWNTELRAGVRGNPPPEFKFGLSGPAGGRMIVTGQFSVRVAGQSPVGATNGNPAAKLTPQARYIQSTLGYSTAIGADSVPDFDEEEESDEEEQAPARSTPPRSSVPAAIRSPKAP